MRTGALRHLIEIRTMATEESASGARTPDWTTVEKVYASIEPDSSLQQTMSDQARAVTRYLVEMRWTPRMVATARIWAPYLSPGGVLLRVSGVRDPDGRRQRLLVSAVQIVGGDK